MTQISAVDGSAIADWAACQQRIAMLIATPIGSRVMRRDYGCEVPRLVDAPLGDDLTVLALYSSVATALLRWEPCFELKTVQLTSADGEGRVGLVLAGDYLPRGHLGDRTTRLSGFELSLPLIR